MLYWTELAYAIVIPTIKFSILVSYFKIFSVLRWFRFALYGTGVLEALWFLGVFPAVIFQCTPIKKAWNPSRPGHCIELIPFLWANSIANTILDYTILLLPVLPVWRLQMSKEQKLLVLASFSLGSLSVIPAMFEINGAINRCYLGQALRVQCALSEPIKLIQMI